MSDIQNGNLDQLIVLKKKKLCDKKNMKDVVELMDLMAIKNNMKVSATASRLEATRKLIDIPIGKDIERIKRTIYGNDEDVDEKTGILSKVNQMFREFVFMKRVYKVLMVFIGGLVVTVIGIIINNYFRG